MASVLNSKAKFYRYLSRENNEIDHHIESEADIFIKELSYKQCDIHLTLKQQLNQEKSFQSSHIYQPFTESISGALSHKDFKNLSSIKEKHISEESNICCNESKIISRHVQELALSVKPNSMETKLLEFAISCNAVGYKKTDNRPIDHPINQLNEIENNLFGNFSNSSNPVRTAKTIMRKRKQLLKAISDPVEIKKKPKIMTGKSLWDVTESVIHTNKTSNSKIYSCKEKKLFTIKNGKIVQITKKNNEDIDTIEKEKDSNKNELISRLSVEDIKKIPKFQNYEEGTPSKTLYLKNLSPNVSEEILELFFAKFQKSNEGVITYNLMKKGKMRGQAFVKFHRIETATAALKELNGTILSEKPVIIQYSSSH